MSRAERTIAGLVVERAELPFAATAHNACRPLGEDELVNYFVRDFKYPALTIEHPIQFIRRPMKPADWARFHVYARRIYRFISPPYEPPVPYEPDSDSYGRSWSALPTLECLKALSCSKPRDMISLCPQIRSLDWDALVAYTEQDSPSSFSYMPLFMGAFTTKVLFSVDGLEPAELSLAQSVLCLFPSIRDITMLYADTDLGGEVLSECLSYGQSLQAVEISRVLPQAAVEHLAGFQHLKRLTLTVNKRLSSTLLSGFCALEELEVTSSTFTLISMFINMLNSQSHCITSFCT